MRISIEGRMHMGVGRIFQEGFQCLVVDPRCRGLGVQPPAAEKV